MAAGGRKARERGRKIGNLRTVRKAYSCVAGNSQEDPHMVMAGNRRKGLERAGIAGNSWKWQKGMELA